MIFAKAPVPGEVKTRLIPTYGNVFATELHRSMLWHSLSRLTQANICPLELWCAPNQDHPFFETCRETFGLSLQVQQGVNLGEKLAHTFNVVLAKEVDNAIVIGVDCPTLDRTDYVSAFDKLSSGTDVVLSPAADGGYVLLGMSKPNTELFQRISWGTKKVFKQTTERALAAGLQFKTLEPHFDIDLPDDIKRLANNPKTLHPKLKKLLLSLEP